jgi:hypothetical protein
LWDNLNEPPYSAFRKSAKLAEPEQGTLQWLLLGDEDETVEPNQDPHAWPDNQPESSLSHENFISWRDSSQSGGLLVTGPPGQGKSVLSNFVLKHLESLPGSKVIYYFCTIKNDEGSRNANSVLRALIVQLCERQRRLFQILPPDFEKDSNNFSQDSLCHILERMLGVHAYPQVYCVIDGLDVYQDGMNDLIVNLTRIFGSVAEADGHILKLFCTGRPNQTILDAWGSSPRRILRCNEDDLDVFIPKKVASLKEGYNRDMKDMMVEKLRQRAERTFLWIDVVIREIRLIAFPTVRQVEEVIETLPNELDKLYEQLVTEAVKRDPYIPRLLACVVYAKQALDLQALGHAVAIDPQESCDSYEQYSEHVPNLTEQLVRQNVGTLLDVVENKVYFIHQSVKDYFKNHNPFLHCFDGIEPRLALAHVCMRYLAMEEIGCSLEEDKFTKY